jgi:hypothetical protein
MISAARIGAVFLAAALTLPGPARASAYRQAPADSVVAVPGVTSQTVPVGRVVDLRLPDGGRQRVLYAGPPVPRGVIVMLPGGAGDVGIERDGTVRHGDNFVVRTRDLWIARGYAVLIPDTFDDRNLRGLRRSPSYAARVRAIVAFAHSQASGAVFLLGTSQGSIAAMNGAAYMPAGQIAGVVLTESVSRLGGSHETVFDADPRAVRVPALVVANRDDRCDVAPPQDAPRIAASMVNAPHVQVLYVAGGIERSAQPCGSLTPHGYYGIEQTVVDEISAWMDRAFWLGRKEERQGLRP